MSESYDKYLRQHISAVKTCYKLLTGKVLDHHDVSKFNKQIYSAYDQHYYGEKAEDEEDALYNYAWLVHQNKEPHHWQYWVLIKDSGKIKPLKMPDKYVNEMIADWASFSLKDRDPDSLKTWYDDHKENITLHPETKQKVEKLIPIMVAKMKEYFNKKEHNNAQA